VPTSWQIGSARHSDVGTTSISPFPKMLPDHALGPFGSDSDLRRHGEKIASRGGKNAKKRAVVAVARKLAVLLHSLWISAEGLRAAAQHPPLFWRPGSLQEEVKLMKKRR
jgi:hypothetical protein